MTYRHARILFAVLSSLLFLIALPLLSALGRTQSEETAAFKFHLVGDYYADKRFFGDTECQLTTTSAFLDHPLLLRKYAVFQKYLIGILLTASGSEQYFIIDTTEDSLENSDTYPKIFQKKQQWEWALASRGIPENLTLLIPHEVAARRPAIEVRPWLYRFTKGRWGFSDPALCGRVVFMGFSLSFSIGVLCGRIISRRLLAVFIGGITFYIEFTIIGDSCSGIIAWPLLCIVLAGLGNWIANHIRCMNPPRDSGLQQQAMDMIGKSNTNGNENR